MNDVSVHEFDRYDVDVINPTGKHVTYHEIAGGKDGIMPDDTLVAERKVGRTVWINVYHYQNEVDLDAEYTPFPDVSMRCVLYFDTEYNLTVPKFTLTNFVDEYRHALCICSKYPELEMYVPYLIRWLRDNDPSNAEVLML